MDVNTWVSMREINSERDLVAGENLQVTLVDTATGEPVETVRFSPTPAVGQYNWTKAFADYINATATHLRAGVQQTDGTFETEHSSYLNKIWTDSASARVALTSACRFSQWSDLYTVNSVGALPEGTTITCRLLNKSTGDVYQTVQCHIPIERLGKYWWPAYLSETINSRGELLRAGEKDNAQKTFVPIGSSFRNHLWAPAGLPLTLEFDFGFSPAALASAAQVFKRLSDQIPKSIPSQKDIDAWLTGFSDGKFRDITYPAPGSTVGDISGLNLHLDRAFRIACYLFSQAAASPAHYLSHALAALNFYARQGYNISWWNRQIGLAKKAGRAAVLLAKHLTGSELIEQFIPYAMKTTNTYAYTQTGANLADFASVQILWSVSAWKNSGQGNYLLYLRAAADVLSGLCLPVEREGKEHGEGVSVDYAINQHNARNGSQYCMQLYSGSYGAELLNRIVEGSAVLVNEFSLTTTALSELVNVVVEGMGWMGYASHMDFHVNGRAISRGIAFNAHIAKWAEALLPVADTANKEALDELIRRTGGDESKNQHYRGGRLFWVNDYLAHIGSQYCVWAKAISTRTVGGESGNGENPKGYYMGAGTYFLSHHGKEYEGIQPVWDWQRLPGTTVEQVADFKWPNTDWGVNMWGSHDFAGGVSDGKRTVLSMELSRKNVTHAYKTVMATDDRVTCLGTGIDTRSAVFPVVTCVNQCIARGPVRYLTIDDHEHALEQGSLTADNIRAVYHDGFVYTLGFFWSRPSVTIEVKNRSGAWSDININGSPDTVTLPVFSLCINHEKGENGFYHYSVSPSEDLSGKALLATASVLEAGIADVHFGADGEAVMVSCFDVESTRRGVQEASHGLYPEQPCVYIAELQDTQVKLTCADPTQTLENLSFVVKADEQGTPLVRLVVSLPQGDERGRSVTVNFLID
ncbi:Polysaccharide lyase protein [Pseudomonas coronafaciens pv. coronafaciens]|uniref:polysaccharide lyase family 8 super-sandwich domain-containing protein n=1 Tax=Pseudomonas coronafaciens TaxID=53409 RepID=UPI000F3B520C|nr:polysaccharide lyase family 8 super-sandwich domain-containing protein [Pseudomonas coronafaciens]RMN97059.1 Polysaccharide lyase protein [Pseudomonas coronafaciens pv. coronafaciens]